MKRVANDVAIQSILYFMNGNLRIRVIDYPTRYDVCTDSTAEWKSGKIVYDGMVRNLNNRIIIRSKCHGMKPWIDSATGELVMLFQICIASDGY